MMASYHTLIFTDFVDDPETRYLMGFSLISVASVGISVNLILISKTSLLEVFLRLKRAWKHMKAKNLYLLNKNFNTENDGEPKTKKN